MLSNELEKLLKADELANISMLGFFSKHNPVRILQSGNSLMVQGKSDEDWWYLSCKSTADFDWFIDQTGNDDRYLATINDQILEQVKRRFTCKWVLSCLRLYLPDHVKLPTTSLKLSSVLISDAEHIYSNSNYKTFSSVEYIREQIKQGPSSAYRVGNTLAGWVLTHDDCAMGMLHVLDEYRRKGIAKDITIDLIAQIRALGVVPYTYVEPTNSASMGLVKSLGFVPDRPIHWVNINR